MGMILVEPYVQRDYSEISTEDEKWEGQKKKEWTRRCTERGGSEVGKRPETQLQ